jgi:hypothetical protein
MTFAKSPNCTIRTFRTFLHYCTITLLALFAIAAIAQNPPGLATRIKSGSSLLGTPCNTAGGNTDFYIQTSVGVFYCKAGTWQQLQDSGAAVHALLSATHSDTTPAAVTRGAGIFGTGTSPTWSLVSAPSSTNGYFKKNSSGDIVSSSGAASGTGACASHNWVSTLNADASPGCTQPALADLQSIAADSVAQNASGSSAAPAAVAIPNCANDNAHALIYSTTSHTWICQSISGGAGIAVQPITAKSGSYTVTTSDFSALTAFIFTCTGTCDVTLPASAPATNGQFVSVKNQGATSIFIMPNGLNLDSTIAPLLLPPKYSALIWTDAANYFTGSKAALGEHSSRRFAAIQAGNAALIAVGNTVTTLANGTLTSTSATSTEGFFEAMTTGSTINTVADTVESPGLWGIASTASNARWSSRFGMDDGAAGVTNIRAFMGLADTACGNASIFGASSVDAINCHALFFRCSSAAGDTNWMALTGKSGSSGVTTASTGVACNTSNHTFAIQEHGGNTAYFFIDGVFKVCIGSDAGCTSAGTHYPTFAAARSVAGITTLNAATKTAHFFWMQAESDL